jgi:hypothetical protein
VAPFVLRQRDRDEQKRAELEARRKKEAEFQQQLKQQREDNKKRLEESTKHKLPPTAKDRKVEQLKAETDMFRQLMAQRKAEEVATLPETISCPNGIMITLPSLLRSSQSAPVLGNKQLEPDMSRQEALKAYISVTRHQEEVVSRRVAQQAEMRQRERQQQRELDAIARSAKEEVFLDSLHTRRRIRQRYCPRLLFVDVDDVEGFTTRPQTKGGGLVDDISSKPSSILPKHIASWPSRRIEFRDAILLVGRAHECDVVVDSLTRPNMVSKVHVLLLVRFDPESSMPVDLWVLDLNSCNGTFLNGTRLKHKTMLPAHQSVSSLKQMKEEVVSYCHTSSRCTRHHSTLIHSPSVDLPFVFDCVRPTSP